MRKNFSVLVAISILLSLTGFRAEAFIGTNYQLQLGNPSNATADPSNHNHYLIQRTVEAIDYSDNLREPNWASWDLTTADVGSSGRSSSFFTDTNLPAGFYEVTPSDYTGSGYERGHMCPSADRTDTVSDNDLVFFMSNMIPQATNNNEGVWANFETYCRTVASSNNEVLITCGPSGFDGSRTSSSGSIAIPAYTWKIAVVVPVGSNSVVSRISNSTRVIAIKVPNNNSVVSTWQTYVTNAAQIQADTGLTFFRALSGPVASALRYQVDGQTSPAPSLSNFSPASGAVGANVVITGTNFGSAQSVTFNGMSASYSVDSAGQITAQVPTNATFGHIAVTTASGTAMSVNNFTVLGGTLQSIQTVFIILMENRNWSEIKGNTASAPYINNTILPMASYANQYYNPPSIHPSLPNYLWLEAGTNFGITDDSDPVVHHQSTTNHLVSLLNRAGVTWTSYQEDIVSNVCPLNQVNLYAPKHNPMVYFDDVTSSNNANSAYCIANVRPFTQMAADLQSNVVTRYNFITPNLCNDMHNSGCGTGDPLKNGDNWLSTNLPVILHSQAYSNNGVVMIVWDESETSDGPIGMMLLSPLAKGGGYSNSVHYTHSSTLRTVQEIFNVTPLLGDAVNATDFSDLFNLSSPALLTVSPTSTLVATGTAGGPFTPSAQTYTLTNSGGAALNWTGTVSSNWLTVSPASGALAAGASTNVSVSFNANANALAAGVYTSAISFTNTSNGAGNTTISVSLTISSAPIATTTAATGVGSTTATLNGSVKPNGQATTALFEYGTTTNYGTTVNAASNLTGFTTQSVSATLNSLAVGATYHFRLDASNSLGNVFGSDQTFTTAASATVDLAILASHSGNFTQGDSADTYTLLITNVGTLATTGTVTVMDTLPAGLTATAISGAGWTTNLATLTCTRADVLAVGAAYPPINITVSIATNAPGLVTNLATVSGGGDANAANNNAADPTTINPQVTGGITGILAGWDVSGLTNYGPSPFTVTSNAANLAVGGLTRGSGIAGGGTAAARGWGGTGFTDTNSAGAISNNHFATFIISANSGYAVSFSSINPFNYRRSSTGPTNGLLQYQLGTNAFSNITTVSYTVSTSAGGTLGPIDLSGIAGLQNIGAGTNVTFRIVNWGGTSAGGTWYIFDVTTNTAVDFAIQGTVTPLFSPIQSWRQQYFGTTANSGQAADTNIVTSDGMANLLKYALSLNPLTPATNPIVGDTATGYLRMTIPKNSNATDISFHVELTSGLPSSTWGTNGTIIDQNTATLLQVHDAQPINSSTSGYMRLRVSRP